MGANRVTPVEFIESNCFYGAPPDLDGAQVATVRAYRGVVTGGSLDGVPIVVTAWKPDANELALLQVGHPIYISFIGGLPPHMAAMDFAQVTHPA